MDSWTNNVLRVTGQVCVTLDSLLALCQTLFETKMVRILARSIVDVNIQITYSCINATHGGVLLLVDTNGGLFIYGFGLISNYK